MDTQTAILLIGAGAFNYFTLYKKNRFFANLAFMMMGLATMATADTTTQTALGLIIMMGSAVNLIYDVIKTKGS